MPAAKRSTAHRSEQSKSSPQRFASSRPAGDLQAKSEPVESLDGKNQGAVPRDHEIPELPHGSPGGRVLPA